jgi:thymidylate kinase
VIELDAATAARRKPGDQSERVLRAMDARYASRASKPGIAVVDGSLPREEVDRELVRRLDALLGSG